MAYTFLYVSSQEDAVKTMSYSESRARYAEVLDSVVDDCEEVVITRAGREPAVIVSLAEYQSLKETDYLLRNPANAKRLLEAVARSRAGQDTYHDPIEVD
ncbi:Antitoxin YefM [Actinomyces israelii]|nr:Antitoxin YefM [Actinomyces israelii]